MKDEHKRTRDAVKEFQKSGIPIAVLREEKRVAILHKDSNVMTFELTNSTSSATTGRSWYVSVDALPRHLCMWKIIALRKGNPKSEITIIRSIS